MITQEIYDLLREIYVWQEIKNRDCLRPFRLTTTQFDTLLHLDQKQGYRMGELGKKVLCDNSKMTRIIDYLEQEGWAERRLDSQDRRAQRVFLTPAGETQRTQAKQAHQSALNQQLTTLNSTQQQQFHTLLTQLRHSFTTP